MGTEAQEQLRNKIDSQIKEWEACSDGLAKKCLEEHISINKRKYDLLTPYYVT